MELRTEKRAISVYVSECYLNITVQNSSHAAYRGSGRVFVSDDRFAEAVESYKCQKVKALIAAAKELADEYTLAAA
jgi:hypothetical protein